MDNYTLLRLWEGKDGKPVLEAYQDSVGVWTIGYGHTKGVKNGDVCTEEQAEQFLVEDTKDAALAIKRCVKVPLNENQYAALLSFTFNLGGGALSRSTLLSYLNEKHYESARDQMSNWVYAGGKKLKGLVNRRADEMRVWDGENPYGP